MWVNLVAIGLGILFGTLAVIFFTGHGGFLVAGYNTASEDEKAQYDLKKLLKVMGWGIVYFSVMFFVMGILTDNVDKSIFKTVMMIFTFGSIPVCTLIIILGNTVCKKKGGNDV